MIYKDHEEWVGVALEFNIVIVGEDPRVVEVELQEAVIGYLEAAKKMRGFRPQQVNAVLNQETEAEYETRWAHATQIKEKGVVSPYSDIYKAGIANLANA